MKAHALKLSQTEIEVLENVDIKSLLEKVDRLIHKLGNEISALNFEAEDLEKTLNAIAEGTDSRLKMETFKAWQHVRKARTNLQIFFKNR